MKVTISYVYVSKEEFEQKKTDFVKMFLANQAVRDAEDQKKKNESNK